MQLRFENAWFVFYTRPRFEKKIKKQLERLDIEHSLPTYMSLRKWKDRKKKVEMLYFPGYIFVTIEQRNLWEVLSLDGVLHMVKQEGKPALVPKKDIEDLLCLRPSSEPEIVNASEIDEGQEVLITSGPMRDLSGKVYKVKNKLKLGIKITSIDKAIMIEIALSDIKIVPTPMPVG